MPNPLSRREVFTTVGGVLTPGISLAQAVTTESRGLTARDIQIPAGGTTIPGYDARPEAAGRYPIVVVISGFTGNSDQNKDVVRRFAQAGYYAIAPELFDVDDLDVPRHELVADERSLDAEPHRSSAAVTCPEACSRRSRAVRASTPASRETTATFALPPASARACSASSSETPVASCTTRRARAASRVALPPIGMPRLAQVPPP